MEQMEKWAVVVNTPRFDEVVCELADEFKDITTLNDVVEYLEMVTLSDVNDVIDPLGYIKYLKVFAHAELMKIRIFEPLLGL